MNVLALSAAAAAAAVVLAAGCSTSDGASSQQVQPIQGGQVDTTHNYAVGVCMSQFGPGACELYCSGALIAPNLVMTARHCVDQTPQQIDCTSSAAAFGSARGQASQYYITTDYQMKQATSGWHRAKSIFRTPGTSICGNDMALIELQENVSAAEAGGTFVTPVVQASITDHTRYSTTVTAIGYGNTSATTTDAGTRHILQNVNILCIPGDSVIDCPSDPQINANEFVSGDSTCEGDSGSSAYEQKNFNRGVPVSFGVLSRGGVSGTSCVEPIYTRTDAWKTFIINTAVAAASDGGYAPPAWTAGATITPDGGTGGPGSQSDAAAPAPGTLGAPCTDASDCNSGVCESQDNGATYMCSALCDPNGDGSDCGASGYTCLGDGAGNGYCFPAPPSSFNHGGCAVGSTAPENQRVPWGAFSLGAAYLAVALIRSRRRRE